MARRFGTVTILGGGLLGGSLALRLEADGWRSGVRLWARRPETVARARGVGVAGATSDLAAAVGGCELLVLATPVGTMADLLEQAIAAGLPAAAVVTDVGSVKRAPVKWLAPVLGGREFVGSHPMAGSQRTGIEVARADLFGGAACIVTGDGPSVAAVEGFWRAVGCRVERMGPAEHDHAVARVSHLPHVLAAVGARVAMAEPELGRLAGGGLRDTTRVAAGDPAMWAEILLENRDAVAGPLRESIAELTDILALLEAGGEEAVREWLAEAKDCRDRLEA
jgi:prephenate dehydrogenase